MRKRKILIQEDNTLNNKEWQLLLVLKELQGQLSEHEKNQKLKQWLERKIKQTADFCLS